MLPVLGAESALRGSIYLLLWLSLALLLCSCSRSPAWSALARVAALACAVALLLLALLLHEQQILLSLEPLQPLPEMLLHNQLHRLSYALLLRALLLLLLLFCY